MSAGGEHLKDEGTKRQVVLAGGAAGLISRFCIAPLDVVKIRLQLQIHSLSDPTSHRTVVGPIYKGTLSTMRDIARQEGITVCSRLLVVMAFRSPSDPAIMMRRETNDFLGIGSMERQHPRRDDVCLLRRPSIHRIPSYNPGAGAIGSVPTPAIRRILRLRCRSRRNRTGDYIPT